MLKEPYIYVIEQLLKNVLRVLNAQKNIFKTQLKFSISHKILGSKTHFGIFKIGIDQTLFLDHCDTCTSTSKGCLWYDQFKVNYLESNQTHHHFSFTKKYIVFIPGKLLNNNF